MAKDAATASPGVLGSLTALSGALLAILYTRLALLRVDIEEERLHFFSLLVTTLAMLFFLGAGLVLACILLIAVFWNTYPLHVLAILSAGFITIAVLLGLVALHKIKHKPQLFSTSLNELGKDREAMKAPL
jgi:uncharacterized membrane protein YqjE